MDALIRADSGRRQRQELEAELAAAQQQLRESEAELATEQAAVNAFRMHCRLLLDDLVDAVQALTAQKQSLLTRLQLRHAEETPREGGQTDPPGPEATDNPSLDEPELLLPTDVPRDKAAEKRLYRELARRFHPDLAESAAELAYRTSVMASVNQAYAAGDVHALYDLAGELEPEEIAELVEIEALETRRLREKIIRCRRRQRKVGHQLQTLRQENTTRLWRRAQELEEQGDNWWAVVRRDLEQARARLEREVADLAEQAERSEISIAG